MDGLLQTHVSRKHPSIIKPNSKNVKKQKSKSICPHCDKAYSLAARLREHIILQHSESAKLIECDTCQRKFASGPRLRDHIKQTHTRERCEICGEELYNMHYLRKHKASVHGILPTKSHKCHFCPEFFMQEHMLQKHLEKQHSQCSWHFASQFTQMSHLCKNFGFYFWKFGIFSHLKFANG